jgi:sec-independent protein translocase protein TatA
MPNVGMSEIFMLFLVILLVVGPKRLPEIARNLGKAYRTFTTEMQKAQETLRVAVEADEKKPPPTPGGGVIDVPDATATAPVATAVLDAPEVPPQEPFQAAAPERPEPEEEPDHGVEREFEDT